MLLNTAHPAYDAANELAAMLSREPMPLDTLAVDLGVEKPAAVRKLLRTLVVRDVRCTTERIAGRGVCVRVVPECWGHLRKLAESYWRRTYDDAA